MRLFLVVSFLLGRLINSAAQYLAYLKTWHSHKLNLAVVHASKKSHVHDVVCYMRFMIYHKMHTRYHVVHAIYNVRLIRNSRYMMNLKSKVHEAFH